MTEKELTERKARADALKVFKTADPTLYLVDSSDGTKLYKVSVSNGAAQCPCPDYKNHSSQGATWKCKHVIAVEEAMSDGSIESGEMAMPMLKKETAQAPPQKLNRALLEAPFPAEQIRQREGRKGVRLDYIDVAAVIKRLNDAFDGHWSFEITEWQHLKDSDEVVVLGKLTAAGITKMQFGVSQITRDRESKVIVALGDDLKAAGSDALKKCAVGFGVGLHLYEDRKPENQTKRESANPKPTTKPSHKLLTELYALAKEKGVGYKELEARSVFLFEKRPPKLTSEEIQKLKEDLNAG